MGRLSHHSFAVAAITAVGTAIRLMQYLAADSFWIDEYLIAFNVTRNSWADLLFHPLDNNQAAPIGFLALEKLASLLPISVDLALRLFPTLASLVSLVLFWRVCQRFLEGKILLLALALFAINPVVLVMARNVKQYSGDVMVTLLLILLALRFLEGKNDLRSAIIGGAIGGVGILMSQPGVLIAVYLFAVLLIQHLRSHRPIASLMVWGAGLGLGALAVTVSSLVLSPMETREVMREGWNDAFVAPPTEDPASLLRLLFDFVAYYFGAVAPDSPMEAAWAAVICAFVFFGLGQLVWRRPGASALLIAPLVVLIAASVARILPLSTRVSAFAGSVLLLAFAAGIEIRISRIPRWARSGLFALAAFVSTVPALVQLAFIPPLYRREYTRPILEQVRGHWRSGDVLYALAGGKLAMDFYGRSMGLDPWTWTDTSGFAPRAYLEGVDQFRGRDRVWFFFADAEGCEKQVVISYLDAIGTRIEAIEDRGSRRNKRSAAYLYGLDDPVRLSRSNAGIHPVPALQEECEPPEIYRRQEIMWILRRLVGTAS